MENWAEGYVSEVGYTFGYYGELNPLRLRLALLYGGLALPAVTHACELGFGQGLTVNIHAAASGVSWHGTDFNPAQAGLAQELAAASGTVAGLHDESFAEFCGRPDLPDFDFIALHGIWSWVSETNRATIKDFIRRKLRPGGVVYVSYNTMPGWSSSAPVRKLLSEYADTALAKGQAPAERIDGALAFVDRMLAAQPAYLAAHPDLAQRIAALKTQDRHYLAHEYFNENWQPMYFSDVARALGEAKLAYAGSARYLDHIDILNLSPAQHGVLSQVADPALRQTMRDFMVNQQFRKDYWVKGARRLAPFDQSEALRQQRVVLVVHRGDVKLVANGAAGEAKLNAEVYVPLLDALADHRPRSLGELERLLAGKGVGFAQMVQALMVLVGQGKVEPAQDDETIEGVRARTDALNAHLVRKARGSGDIGFLASPVTGGGIAVLRAAQLFLWARSQGQADPAAWAQLTWNLLAARGETLMKDGKPLQSAAENVAQLTVQARAFADKQLPMLRALKVAD